MSLNIKRLLKPISDLKNSLSGSPIAYRLARGAAWSLIGELAVRALSLVSSIIVARLLGKVGFGEMGMISSTLGMFGVFAGFGLGTTSVKYIAEFREKDPGRAGAIASLTIITALITGGIMMIICLVLSPWMAAKTLGRPEMTPLLAAGSLLLFISILGGVQNSALSGLEAYREITQTKIIQGIAGPLTTIPLVWMYGVQGAVASFTISASIHLLCASLAVRRRFKFLEIPTPSNRTIWREWPILYRFAFPSMMSAMLVTPVMWITNTILVRQPNGFGELGLFNAANQWRSLIIFVPGLLSAAMLPVLSETYAREDKTDFVETISLNLRVTILAALPATVAVIALGRDLSILFGKQFSGMEPIIAPLMVSCFLILINSSVGTAISGAGRMWSSMLLNLGWALLLIVLSIFFIPYWGGKGLAYAYATSYFLHTIWIMAYVQSKLAPKVVSAQSRLLSYSAVVLFFCFLVGMFNLDNRLVGVFLMAMALLPLAKACRVLMVHHSQGFSFNK